MTDKTIGEIRGEHSAQAGGILAGYQDAVDGIRAETEPEAGAYLDRLTDEQRMRLLRDQKARKADDAHREAREAYSAEVERYHEELAKRRDHLKGRLFGVGGPDGAAALSRTVTATEGELRPTWTSRSRPVIGTSPAPCLWPPRGGASGT